MNVPLVAKEMAEREAGLTSAEAQRRLEQCGPNAIATVTSHFWRRVLGKFFAPVPCMLEAAIVLQLVLGQQIEALVMAALVVFNAALGLFHEGRAEATLNALKSRLALNASVRREGDWIIVPAKELVPGDVVKLSLGSVVPADVEVHSGNVLLDQSMLTGESLPVEGGIGTITYAGALVRRGEAVAEVTATGGRTKFGRTAELVRTAHVTGSQQKAIFRVVRNLALFNGLIVLLQLIYATWLGLPVGELVPLLLTAMLAAIPMALPATFTLATAFGAEALAKRGVLLTRLSAVDEAASMDVLCVDKTGTLTRNALSVVAVRPLPGYDIDHVLAFAGLASSDGGQDPVDQAIRRAAAQLRLTDMPTVRCFFPFDPEKKRSEALACNAQGRELRIVKGAFAYVNDLAGAKADVTGLAEELEAQGARVLAVAVGEPQQMAIVGLIALADPPRADSAVLISRLRDLGVHVVMVTGDAPVTAATIARAVGINGPVFSAGQIPDRIGPEDFAVFAGILPEDKFNIVKAFQRDGHVVGMCGDGANDAAALRQSQMGIAVASATDVAKAAAGMVLTESGLGSIVAAIREGRITFQRILTYTLRSLTRKIDQLLFLTLGLVLTGHAILTPLLMIVLMTTGDFLAMAATTDNVRPSVIPNNWRINHLTLAGLILGACNLLFCGSILAFGKFRLGFDLEASRSLAVITLVFSGQAVLYVVRERHRLWASRPSVWLMASSAIDLSFFSALAIGGWLMAPLPPQIVAGLGIATIIFAFVLDQIKILIFRHLAMA
ncbi:HAD-IC family P-type ATPase [Methylovirgula sp. 4M-Z18]|uniref:HAD-IC family P-type ATPase n=1 Tax=Methylovirgula sp. 4M-Z18 TaxID=2293567 RepID=UPI000E2E59DB|nr:HAD-IC family P-type ATPase [Methylovirgula sp. 4M-Z18]RFB76491.1 HAD family hydrolase [Methylovirgula sp. 4M-Z18]